MNPEQRTILIVEDERPVRKLVAIILQRAGYLVLEASDSKEAVAIWSQQSDTIDLLVSDISMPGLSGPELASDFRTKRPTLKVLFTSGNSMESLTDSARLGPNAQLLQKPFVARQLLEAVEAILRAP